MQTTFGLECLTFYIEFQRDFVHSIHFSSVWICFVVVPSFRHHLIHQQRMRYEITFRLQKFRSQFIEIYCRFFVRFVTIEGTSLPEGTFPAPSNIWSIKYHPISVYHPFHIVSWESPTYSYWIEVQYIVLGCFIAYTKMYTKI